MENFYTQILSFIRKTKKREKNMILFCKYIPYVTALSYLWLLLFLIFTKDQRLLISVLKPVSVFLLVTIIRKLINRPRPYDSLQIKPLFLHKSGESFPSRHTASAFIIAFTCFSIFQPLGIVLLIVASIVAITRVIAGVHYISDVIVAIIIAWIGWIIYV